MERKKISHELEEYYGKRFPDLKGKQHVVTNEWKNMKKIKDRNEKINN